MTTASGTMSGWMNRIWDQCRISMQRGRRRNSKSQPVPVAALEQRTLLAAIVVNSNLDNTTVDAFTTLREAIIQANASPEADTITFGNGQTNFTDATADTITLGGTRIEITDSVTITGLAANKLSISANNLSQVFYVNGSAAPGTKVVTIQGVTLTGGNALGGGSTTDGFNSGNFGGALMNNRATLNLRGVAVSGNQAAAASGGNGGGGLYNWLDATSVMNITDSTISGNSSGSGDGGGGIMNWTGILNIQNSTVSGNTTTGTGGGIKNFYAGASLTATNVTITGNTAVSGGGISDNSSSSDTLRNSIVAGNISSVGSTANDITGTINTASNNLIGDAATSGGITNGTNGNLVGNAGVGTRAIATILNTTLADNGGPTRTHQLAANSVAINAGSNASVIGPTATLANLLQPGNFIAAGSTQFETFTPYNALDNNPSTFSHTDVTDTNSSWTIKLSRDQEIRQVVLTNRIDGVPGRFRDITVEVLDENGLVVFTSPVLNPRATAGNSVLVGPPTLTATLPNGITGRTIRVSRLAQPGFGGSAADQNVLSLAEVGVLGIPLNTDQRGGFFGRIIGTNVDIGAVESQDFAGADAADPDDQISEAQLIPVNTTRVRPLSRSRDVDMYAFDVVAGQTVTFDVDTQQLTGWMRDSFLRIFDSTGAQLAINDDGVGPGLEPNASPNRESFISHTFATGGRYYVGVSPFPNDTYNATTGTDTEDANTTLGLYQLAITSTLPAIRLANTTTSIAENTSTATRTKMADIILNDDGSGLNVLSLTGADAASFEILGNVLYLKAGVTLNFEVKATYNVTVNVDDAAIGAGIDNSASHTLTVTNVQEAPTFTGPTSFTFEEFSARWTNIGKLNATDPEGNALTYSIVGGNPDNTLYVYDGSVVATGGQIAVFNQDLTGLRHRGMFNLRVRVTDNGPGALFSETDVKIFITPSPNGTTRIDPSANGDVTDGTNNGFDAGDTVVQDGNMIVSGQGVTGFTGGPSRGIMEFNLASQPTNRVLKSAWLFFTAQNIYDGDNSGTANVPIDVYGYTGNGVVNATDATAGNLIGSRTINNSGGSNQLKVHAAQLDTNYVRTLIGSGQLGLALRTNTGVDGISLITTNTFEVDTAQRPYLVLQYGDLPPDIVVRDNGPTGTGNAFVTLKSNGTTAFTVNTANVFAAGSWERFLTGDFNADGRTDIAGRLSNNGQWWVSLANASGVHQAATQWGSWSTAVTWNDALVADFDGDGRADIAGRLSNAGPDNGNWWVSSSTGAAFTDRLWGNWSSANTWSNATVGDFNRDGRMDIAGRNNLGQWHVSVTTGATPATAVFTTSQWGLWSTATVWSDVQIGDFNGDGRTDIAGRSSIGQWWVNRSTGTSFAAALFYGNWSTGTTWSDVRVADFNGDGRDDILGRTSIGQWWVAETAVNPSFTMKLMGTRAPVQSQWGEMVVGDFNRDGRADIATRNNLDNSVWVSLWTITGNTPSFATSSWGNLPTVGTPQWRLLRSGRLNG